MLLKTLISMLPLLKIEPHALDLLVRPRIFVPGTMVRTEAIISYFIFHKFWLFSTQVRLMYERVPRNRPPLLQHLEDPVVGFISSTSCCPALSRPVLRYYRHIMGLFCLGLIYHHQTIELSRVLILSPHY